MFPKSRNNYIGGHIRTWGYFNNFKDFIGKERFDTKVSTFNTSKVNSTILTMIRKYYIPFFLSTESIKLKEIIKKSVEGLGFSFMAYMEKVSHSRSSDKESFGIDIIIDIEILTYVEALILSADSTFSKTLGFKNKNCFIKKCYSIRTCDRSVYEGVYDKKKK